MSYDVKAQFLNYLSLTINTHYLPGPNLARREVIMGANRYKCLDKQREEKTHASPDIQ